MAENENVNGRTDVPESGTGSRPGGDTGSQFVKKIGVVGCVFFLVLSIIFTVFCFTAKPAAQTPPEYEQTEGTSNG